MKKIFTGLALAITTLPVFANDVQIPAPTAPVMPSVMMPKAPPMGKMQAPQMPNMKQFYGGNNGSNWKMPTMNWGNNGGNGSSWKMPTMNWGNNGGNGSSWKMPTMNWGNHNPVWNGAPMYMAVPMAPTAPMMKPVAPKMNTPQQAQAVLAQQKAMESKPVKKLSATDIVQYKIEQMKRLNAAVAKQLAGTAKEAPKVEAPAVAK